MLARLTSSARRIALAGLAKNTGKTVALTALLAELHAAGERVGVTSIGRDGEEHDVIDARIDKPRVELAAGDLVATTDALLQASGLAHDVLEETTARTPLGRVVLARLGAGGAVEVAGPSAASQVREVADAMLEQGAERVLIDGAIDRRAASSPSVAEGLVLATGAVLGEDIEAVVLATRRAVELIRLPTVPREFAGEIARFATRGDNGALVGVGGQHGADAALRPYRRSGAACRPARRTPRRRTARPAGSGPRAADRSLASVLRQRRRELTLVAGDPTHVFLSAREPGGTGARAWSSKPSTRSSCSH